MHKLTIGIFSFLLFLSVTATPLFAGGGPVALHAFPLRPFDQTKTFIVEAEIYSDEPCDQIKATFTFKDPKDGDSITPYTTPLDGTYITRHYNTGQPNYTWKEICNFYMAAKSQTAEQRIITVNVFADGKTHTRETSASFGDDYYSKQLQSFGRMNDHDNTPHVDVISEKYLGGPKRELHLQWQKIPWATKYAVYAREIGANGNIIEPSSPLITTEDTKTTINLAAFTEFYLSVSACRIDDCTYKKDGSYEYLVDKMRNTNQTQSPTSAATQPTAVVTTSDQPTDQQTTDSKVEELNKKVAELEGKLDESTKKQSALEKTVNDLLTWIKSRFPFFQ